jgi:hypothetical protein
MLITELGDNDLILGRAWAAYLDILIDCRNHQLVWPEHQERSYNRVITARKQDIVPKAVDHDHQKDAERRDRL